MGGHLFTTPDHDLCRAAHPRARDEGGDPVGAQRRRSGRAIFEVPQPLVQRRPGSAGEVVGRTRFVRDQQRARPLRHRARQRTSERLLDARNTARSPLDDTRDVGPQPIGEEPHETVRALVIADRIALPLRQAAPVVRAPLEVRRAFRTADRGVPAIPREVLGHLRERLVDPGHLRPVAALLHAAVAQIQQVLNFVGQRGGKDRALQILRRIPVRAAVAHVVEIDDLGVVRSAAGAV